MLLQDWRHHYRSLWSSSWNRGSSSLVYPGLHFLWATQWVFLEKQRTLTLPLQLFHAPSFYWSPICSFTLVTLYVLLWLFYVLCCVCLFSMSALCPWVTFLWFPLEPWFPWLLFWIKRQHTTVFMCKHIKRLSASTCWSIPTQQPRCCPLKMTKRLLWEYVLVCITRLILVRPL